MQLGLISCSKNLAELGLCSLPLSFYNVVIYAFVRILGTLLLVSNLLVLVKKLLVFNSQFGSYVNWECHQIPRYGIIMLDCSEIESENIVFVSRKRRSRKDYSQALCPSVWANTGETCNLAVSTSFYIHIQAICFNVIFGP